MKMGEPSHSLLPTVGAYQHLKLCWQAPRLAPVTDLRNCSTPYIPQLGCVRGSGGGTSLAAGAESPPIIRPMSVSTSDLSLVCVVVCHMARLVVAPTFVVTTTSKSGGLVGAPTLVAECKHNVQTANIWTTSEEHDGAHQVKLLSVCQSVSLSLAIDQSKILPVKYQPKKSA